MVMGKKSRKADGGGVARCRRHRQQVGAGVCPLCLRERLSRLSLSESLPSVVACDEEEEDAASSSCSDYSEAASSTEGSTGASSASGSDSPGFHREVRRGAGAGARPSLLMRHERVVGADGDEVVAVLRRRRERTSFWAKLLRATTRGGGGRKEEDRCLVAHSKTLAAERTTATKWILF